MGGSKEVGDFAKESDELPHKVVVRAIRRNGVDTDSHRTECVGGGHLTANSGGIGWGTFGETESAEVKGAVGEARIHQDFASFSMVYDYCKFDAFPNVSARASSILPADRAVRTAQFQGLCPISALRASWTCALVNILAADVCGSRDQIWTGQQLSIIFRKVKFDRINGADHVGISFVAEQQ
jgi:hypothetical protein